MPPTARRAALVAAATSAISLTIGGTAVAGDPVSPLEITPPASGPVQRTMPADDPKTVNVEQKHYVAEPEPGSAGEAARAAASESTLAASLSDCPAGWDCMWTGGYFTGPLGKLAGQNGDWSVFAQSACSTSGSSGANWKDCASSVYARTSNGFGLRRDLNYQGGGLNLASGNSAQQLDPWFLDNNTASNAH